MGEMLNKEKVNEILDQEAEKARGLLKNREALLGMLVKAEKKVRETEALSSIQDLGTMINIVRSYAYGSASGISEDAAAVMAGALFYLTEEEDFFIDSTPVIGLLDDSAVIFAAIERTKKELGSAGK